METVPKIKLKKKTKTTKNKINDPTRFAGIGLIIISHALISSFVYINQFVLGI